MRAFSSSVFSLLLTVTLFWGGCISCPKFFMFPTAEKSCCSKGKCERPEKTAPLKECKRMPLEVQGFASSTAEHAVAVVMAGIPRSAALRSAPIPGVRFETAAVEHSPPDLTVLHSSFLI